MIRYMMNVLSAAMRDRKGVTALEYAILAVAILGAVAAAGTVLSGDISTRLVGLPATSSHSGLVTCPAGSRRILLYK
jgi:Flp pilus assembly pilin Flp